MARKSSGAKRTFEDLLPSQPDGTQKMAKCLRRIVKKTLADVDEGIYGGAKVGLALYSRGGPANVLCGIQPSGEACLFYVHHLKHVDHERIVLTGKGKHARHVRYESPENIREGDVQWLLRQVEERAAEAS